MIPMTRKLVVGLLVLGVPWLAGARSPSSSDPLDTRVSIDLVEADAQDALRTVGDVLGLPVEIEPGVAGSLTIRLHDVRLRNALAAACDTLRCSFGIHYKDGVATLRFAREGESAWPRKSPQIPDLDVPISLSLAGAKLGVVLDSFGRICGATTEVDPRLADRSVSIELQNVPAREALDTLAELHRFGVEVVSEEPLALRFVPDQ